MLRRAHTRWLTRYLIRGTRSSVQSSRKGFRCGEACPSIGVHRRVLRLHGPLIVHLKRTVSEYEFLYALEHSTEVL